MTVSTKIDINLKEVLKVMRNFPKFPHKRRLLFGLSLVIFAIVSACKQGPPRPEDNLKAFLSAVRSKRGAEAWKYLSASSQSELNKRAQQIAKVTEKPVETKLNRLLFDYMELMTIRAPQSISVTSPISSTASLRVTLKDGQTANMLMIREGPSWKVDLFRSLSPVPTSTISKSD